jgi:hypothetical protein
MTLELTARIRALEAAQQHALGRMSVSEETLQPIEPQLHRITREISSSGRWVEELCERVDKDRSSIARSLEAANVQARALADEQTARLESVNDQLGSVDTRVTRLGSQLALEHDAGCSQLQSQGPGTGPQSDSVARGRPADRQHDGL